MLKSADAARIERMLRGLDAFNATPGEGTTRILFTSEEIGGRAYIMEEMRKLGLRVSADAAGNIFATLPGSRPDLAPVWSGSHIDTVPNAGMFDGMAGVVAPLEAVRLIRQAGLTLKRDLTVVVYTSEEPTRFGLGCLGSRALAGALDAEAAKNLRDAQGETYYGLLEKLGYPVGAFDALPRKRGDVYAAVELHIEQSGYLERDGKQIGVVKAVCAPTAYEVTVRGRQSHAGACAMPDRRDAFPAVCEIALYAEQLGRLSQSEYTTVTVGRVQVTPNAANVIPGRVDFTVDIRDTSYEYKRLIMKRLEACMLETAKKRGLDISWKLVNDDDPMPCNRAVMRLIQQSAQELGYSTLVLHSGAFHDSMLVGTFAPVAMIFIPSKDGLSHCPQEWTDFEQVAQGANVLTRTLVRLCGEEGPLDGMGNGK